MVSTAHQLTPPYNRIAVLYHPKIEATKPIAREIHDWLTTQGIASWTALTWNEEDVRPRIPKTDLTIVLGGDGSMLRAARMTARHGVPVLGVNMGRLGFLTEVTPDNWRERLPLILEGEGWIEERMMLQTKAWRGSRCLGEHLALNEVVVSRGTLARVVQLRTEIDEEKLTTYVADGLIVSTPTGSTAYALAAGGPILPPDLRNILVIPIAPHLTLDRAIVLSEGSMVRVWVTTDHQAILTVDGQYEFDMQDGDHIDVHSSEYVSRFLRLSSRSYFYHLLLDRLEPKRIDNSDE